MSVLAERLLAVHDALQRARLRHAFGGAIALAYCTKEPRGTRDLDVNVFVGIDRADDVLDALPKGVTILDTHRRSLRRHGQVRVMWETTPIDVFLDTHEFHHATADAVVDVVFERTSIPVLGCTSLIVFKAMFDRTRDWADIEAMLDAGIDPSDALDSLRDLLGPADPIVARLERLRPRR